MSSILILGSLFIFCCCLLLRSTFAIAAVHFLHIVFGFVFTFVSVFFISLCCVLLRVASMGDGVVW